MATFLGYDLLVEPNLNITWLENFFSSGVDYARSKNLRIVVNEFGAKRYSPGADLFLDDQMSIFEDNNWNYMIWD